MSSDSAPVSDVVHLLLQFSIRLKRPLKNGGQCDGLEDFVAGTHWCFETTWCHGVMLLLHVNVVCSYLLLLLH